MPIFNFLNLKNQKRASKRIDVFYSKLNLLENNRDFIKPNTLKRLKRKYKRTYLFSQNFETQDQILKNRLSSFINSYNNIDEWFSNFNSNIQKALDISNEFLNSLNKLRFEPQNQQLIDNILGDFNENYKFISSGSSKKLPLFINTIDYYSNISNYINLWKEIKYNYDKCEEFIPTLAQYENKFIPEEKEIYLLSFKKHFVYILKEPIKKEIFWDISNYPKILNQFETLPILIRQNNYKFLFQNIKTAYLETAAKIEPSPFKSPNFCVTNIINNLYINENVSKDQTKKFFEDLNSDSDDPFEIEIYYRLYRDLEKNCIILKNIYLGTKSKNFPTCQIDLILFYKGAIYVMELKNSSGNIYGSYTLEKWKRSLKSTYGSTYYKGEPLNNPIKQNEWKIKTLKNIYDFPYKNIVLFGEEANLFVKANNVFKYQEFLDYLQKQEKYPTQITNEIYYRLCLRNLGNTNNIRWKHISAIHKIHH